MADAKDMATEALTAGAIKAYEDEAINGDREDIKSEFWDLSGMPDDAPAKTISGCIQSTYPSTDPGSEYVITAEDVVACVTQLILQPPDPVGFVQSLDPWNPPETEFKIHWTGLDQEGAPPSVSTTYTSDLSGLAARTYEHTAFHDYAHWDRCVREEAARQLEVPRNALACLQEAATGLEHLESAVTSLEDDLDTEWEYNSQFSNINYEITKLYHLLDKAAQALVAGEVDHRLPALLRDGTRQHALVSNPYPQHKDARE